MQHSLVVVPTYNEVENIEEFLRGLLRQISDIEVLVVDDSSPDGTAEKVRSVQADDVRIHLLLRKAKEGLGPAYVEGMKWALDQGYELIIQMDADFSHRVVDLVRMRESLSHADFVVGARWVPGGGIKNWSWYRRMLSVLANIYVQFLLGSRLHDWTGGFNIWRRKVLESIDLDRLEATGYCFQVELKYRAVLQHFRPIEVPILFEERRHGESKMSIRIITEALFKIWFMRYFKPS